MSRFFAPFVFCIAVVLIGGWANGDDDPPSHEIRLKWIAKYEVTSEQKVALLNLLQTFDKQPLDIPVRENELGDMNQDSVVNIFDLLRIRNISINTGGEANAYEMIEGDMNQDGGVSLEDAAILKNALLGISGVPATIGSKGGVVSHENTFVNIPPGELTETSVLCLSKIDADSLKSKSDLKLSELDKVGYTHMNSFELESMNESLLDIQFQLMEVVEGDTIDLSEGAGLYQSYPDVDGDGNAELRFMSPLAIVENEQNNASLLGKINELVVQSSKANILPTIAPSNSLEGASGDTISVISSSEISVFWAQDIQVRIMHNNGLVQQVINATEYDDKLNKMSFVIPPLPAGNYLFSMLVPGVGTYTNDLSLIVNEPIIDSDIDPIITSFFSLASRLFQNYSESDEFVRRQVYEELINKDMLSVLKDSVMNMSIEEKKRLSAIITPFNEFVQTIDTLVFDNVGKNGVTLDANNAAKLRIDLAPNLCAALSSTKGRQEALEGNSVLCEQCKAAFLFECSVLGIVAAVASPVPVLNLVYTAYAAAICSSRPDLDCCNEGRGKCDDPTTDICSANKGNRRRVEGYYDGNNLSFHCLTYVECPTAGTVAPPFSQGGSSIFKNIFDNGSSLSSSSPTIPDYSGLVIRANSPLVQSAVVDNMGRFNIGLPPDGLGIDSLTLTAFDPNTGLSDEKFWTGKIIRHIGSNRRIVGVFNPNQSQINHVLQLGLEDSDIVNSERQRHVYRFYVSEENIEDKFNFVFQASSGLFVNMTSPSGQELSGDLDGTCLSLVGIDFNETGFYEITIAKGFSGGEGTFSIGIDSYPHYPISRMCGQVTGILSERDYYLAESVEIPKGDSLIIEKGSSVDLGGNYVLTNNGDVIVKTFNQEDFFNGAFFNAGNIKVLSDSIAIGKGLRFVLGEQGTINERSRLSEFRILSNGSLTHQLKARANILTSNFVIDKGGLYTVTGKGYRGTKRNGWTGDRAETEPGFIGAFLAGGGSHGGLAHRGPNPNGSAGEVYGSIENPSTFGAGGSHTGTKAGHNGGGVVLIEADELIVDGIIAANGQTNAENGSAGGAGGSINIRVGKIGGTGLIQANGGASGFNSGGAGGGRIAIHWEEGTIDDLEIEAKGGASVGGQFNGGQPGGAGTVFLNGPGQGEEGRLIVSNRGVNGATTPFFGSDGRFSSVEVRNGGKLIADSLLIAADSISVVGLSSMPDWTTQLVLPDSSTFSTPYLYASEESLVNIGKGIDLELPRLTGNSRAYVFSATDLNYPDASLFHLDGGIFENRLPATFTIERFENDHLIDGTFRNYSTLVVESDSIVIGEGFILEENGFLNEDDRINRIRVLGQLAHTSRLGYMAHSTQPDSGLAFIVDELLYLEEGGLINATGRGYRGTNREQWTSGRSESAAGVLGATLGGGGSHGGAGHKGGRSDGNPGEVFGSLENPLTYGAGGSNAGTKFGQNGGGLINIQSERFVIDGIITANGRNNTENNSAGGAGGSINLKVGEISGTGEIRSNGGNSGHNAGGAGGGRIAIRWDSGSIEDLLIEVLAGKRSNTQFNGGRDGQPGTIYLLGPDGVVTLGESSEE